MLQDRKATRVILEHREPMVWTALTDYLAPMAQIVGTTFQEEPRQTIVLALLGPRVIKAIKANQCNRAILVGHNAAFDLGFVNAAVARTEIKRNPFHPFSSLDTVTLGAMAHGQTVLSRILDAAKIPFDDSEAHSAVYDAEKTADLFCSIINRWQRMEALSAMERLEPDSVLKNDTDV